MLLGLGNIMTSWLGWAAFQRLAPKALRRVLDNLLRRWFGFPIEFGTLGFNPTTGALSIQKLRMAPPGPKEGVRIFLDIERIDVRLHDLFRKPIFQIFGEVNGAKLIYQDGSPRACVERLMGAAPEAIFLQLRQSLKGLPPFVLNRLTIENSQIDFVFNSTFGAHFFRVGHVKAVLENLSNLKEQGPLEMHLEGGLSHPQDVDVRLEADVFGPQPHWRFSLLAKKLALHSFQKEIRLLKILGREGELTVRIEDESRNGLVQGYASALLENVELEALPEARWDLGGFLLRLIVRAKHFFRSPWVTTVHWSGSVQDPEWETSPGWHRLFYPSCKEPGTPEGFRRLAAAVHRAMEDSAPRMSAALAYYTAFSIAPLLIVIIAFAGLVWGRDAAAGEIYAQIRSLTGPDTAKTIQEMIENSHPHGIQASVIGVLTILIGGTGVLIELKAMLNHVFRVQGRGHFKTVVWARIESLGLVLGIGFLLLVSLAISAAIAAMGKYMQVFLPFSESLLQSINFLISFAFVTCLFTFIYKGLPDCRLSWRDCFSGALPASLLFGIGKTALGIYLGKSAIGSSYGAAGSILIVLIWVYYSTLVLYFGAEYIAVGQDKPSVPIQPKKS